MNANNCICDGLMKHPQCQWTGHPQAHRIDPIDSIIAESARLAMLALEVLNGCRQAPTEWPRPSVRAASLLRAAADLLGDLAG